VTQTNIRKRAQRLLAEFVVIVFGVLIALAVDEARQTRNDRATEQVVLEGLLDELRENRTRVEVAETWHDRRRRAQEELLRFSGAPIPVSSDSVDALWSLALTGGVYGEAEGALSSVLVSGQLSLIEDDALRILIGQWPRGRRVFDEWEAEYKKILADDLMPIMKGRYSLPSAITTFPMPGTPDYQALERALSDPVIVNNLRHLAGLWPVFEILVMRRQQFLDQLEERILENLTRGDRE